VKPFRFHREALAEAKISAEHYAAISPELGLRFYDTVDRLVREVCAQPTLHRVLIHGRGVTSADLSPTP
jgi:hypothetical protein